MNIWHQIPFVRLVIPFTIGIVAGIGVGVPFRGLIWIMAGVLIIYLAYISVGRINKKYASRWVNGAMINAFLLLAGYQLTIMNTARFRPDDISHFTHAEKILVRIIEPVEQKERSVKVIGRPVMVFDSVEWRNVSGKILLYFEKDTTAENLKYGDRLVVMASLQSIRPPLNPAEFDYRRYLSHRNIYCQAYVKKDAWALLERNAGKPLKALGIGLRGKFLNILEENGLAGKEYAVASAILLGYSEHLDSEQRRQFAGAGAMHILCVSGLHVGIIYLVLSGLLGFMKRRKWLVITKTFLLLLSIWFYALVTGFSPSVLRASTMFSFVVIGQSLSRKPNIYNSLAGSAFLLLMVNPNMITAVGFQLSYLAVLGIVTIYKPIYSLFATNNWLIDKVWSITVVGLSATFATFPLTTFYFNQFPNLFLITNLVAIPAATLILYTGMLVLITSPVSFLSDFFAMILTWVIRGLNSSVGWIEGLSFSTLTGLYISTPDLLVVILICISIAFLLLQHKRIPGMIALSGLTLLMASFSHRKTDRLSQEKLVVYHVPNSTAIEFIKGRQEVLLGDSTLLADPRKIDFHIKNFRARSGIRKPENILLDQPMILKEWIVKSQNFIRFGNRTIALVDPGFKLFPSGQEVKVDYIILTGNPRVMIKDIRRVFDFSEIIFDSSNAFWMIEKWIRECEEQSIPYHAVSMSGARVIDF